jgi:nitroreductase
MDSFSDLVLRNRSYRRFQQQRRVARQTLIDLVDLARQSGSAANRQPLRYMPFHSEEDCARIFAHLKWAALLKGWGGPAEGERPAAYLLVLGNPADGGMPPCDAGIAMQTLLLAATARGLGGCMLGAIDRPKLVASCRVPEGMELLFVVALGYPAETVVLEEAVNGDIGYYRDANGVHHVPKRPLREVLLSE